MNSKDILSSMSPETVSAIRLLQSQNFKILGRDMDMSDLDDSRRQLMTRTGFGAYAVPVLTMLLGIIMVISGVYSMSIIFSNIDKDTPESRIITEEDSVYTAQFSSGLGLSLIVVGAISYVNRLSLSQYYTDKGSRGSVDDMADTLNSTTTRYKILLYSSVITGILSYVYVYGNPVSYSVNTEDNTRYLSPDATFAQKVSLGANMMMLSCICSFLLSSIILLFRRTSRVENNVVAHWITPELLARTSEDKNHMETMVETIPIDDMVASESTKIQGFPNTSAYSDYSTAAPETGFRENPRYPTYSGYSVPSHVSYGPGTYSERPEYVMYSGHQGTYM